MRRRRVYAVSANVEPSDVEKAVADDAEEAVAQAASDLLKIREGKLQYKVFNLLKDQQWHCRECEGKAVGSNQYAGGGGIQGLQRGTKTRSGIEIKSEKRPCPACGKMTLHDRWTGETKTANAAANIPAKLVERILKVYGYRDAIEDRPRSRHELVVDHRFPMERWGQAEVPHDVNMSEADIRRRFQLLKKDEGGNHNLLKSRACERCIADRKRGTPLGLRFWYEGGEDWPILADRGMEAEAGCVGCGWYDFQQWREAMNRLLVAQSEGTC